MTNYFLKRENRTGLCFLIVEGILYISFMYLDLFCQRFSLEASYIKFIGIILCFIYVLLPAKGESRKMDITLLRGALFFTVVSDLFILILDYYLWGVVTFCLVQLLYLIRLKNWLNGDKEKKIKNISFGILRNLGTAAVVLILLKLFNIAMEPLIVVTAIYFISILFNVFESFIIAGHSRVNRQALFAVSMFLFLCCDMNVGIFNLSNFIMIKGTGFQKLYQFSTIAMWMFYLPAQVGIAWSKE